MSTNIEKGEAIFLKFPEFNQPGSTKCAFSISEGVLSIDHWSHPTVPKPDDATLEQWVEDTKAAKDAIKNERKNRKQQIFQDLNIPAGKRAAFLQGLRELLADGHEN